MDETKPTETNALAKATYATSEDDLRWMVLDQQQLPRELRDLETLREEVLDNEAMAESELGGRTAEALADLGRLTGYVREFGAPGLETGEVIAAATVAHLFESQAAVSRWIDDVFVREFLEDPGADGPGRFLSTKAIEVSGLHDHAAAIFATQEVPIGTISSTIVDFRVGRLLGVAYVITPGEVVLRGIAEELAQTLERHMVGVVLGSA